MTATVLDPVGVDLGRLPLAELSGDEVHALRLTLARRGVIVAREQHLDDRGFERFLLRFGAPVFTVGETPLPGHPNLNLISNVGRTTPPRSVFHVDTSYLSRPPAYTALRAVRIPERGGQTLFSSAYRAAATLSPQLRARCTGRSVTHVVTGVDPGPDQEHSADHPLLRPHPLTGEIALYLTTPTRCAAVSGLDAAAAAQLIDELYAHATRPDNVYRHQWRPGDVVMWDNGAVMHRADHDGVVGERIMHRGMVDGYAAAPAP